MCYSPGTHILATLYCENTHFLQQYDAFEALVDNLILKHDLEKLGVVYHNFSPAGFTAVVCLSESHLSIHTWPEHGKINLDIYLSNHLRQNDGTVAAIYDAIKEHFSAAVEQEQIIKR